MLTADQIAARKHFVGASEAGAVVGVSPYETALDVYLRKTTEAQPAPMNLAMKLGHWVELPLIKEFMERHPEVRSFEPSGTLTHPTDRLGATPDALITYNSGRVENLQIKTAGSRQGWGEPGTDEIPPHYWVQVQVEMHITGLSTSQVIVLFRDRCELDEYVVQRDDDAIGEIVNAVNSFWQGCVVPRIPPVLDLTHPKASQSIKYLYPDANDELLVDEDPDVFLDVEKYLELAQHAKDVDASMESIKNRLCLRMGAAGRMMTLGGVVTWKSATRKGGVDWQACAQQLAAEAGLDLAAVVEKNTKPDSTSRRFLVKGFKK